MPLISLGCRMRYDRLYELLLHAPSSRIGQPLGRHVRRFLRGAGWACVGTGAFVLYFLV